MGEQKPPDRLSSCKVGRVIGAGNVGEVSYVLIRFPQQCYPVRYNADTGERMETVNK